MKKIFLLFVFSRLGFAQAQNIGIGISNPTRAKLEVHGAVDATSAIFGGEGSGISLQRNWPGIGFNSYYKAGHRYMANGFGAVQFLDPINGYMALDLFGYGMANNPVTDSRRVLVISKEGRLGVGSGSLPNATFEVARGNGSDGTAVFHGTVHRSYFNYGTDENTYIRAGKDYGTVFINDIPGSKVSLSGFVGIGTATPVYPLEIRQADNKGLIMVDPSHFHNWEFNITPDNAAKLQLKFNGATKGYFQSADGSYYTVSDQRLKTNIRPLPSLLDKLLKLQPVAYEMMHDNPARKTAIGFLAQDVKALFPELVGVTADTAKNANGITDLHAINYSGVGVIAVKALQEQQALIKEQGQLLEALKEEIADLEKAMGTGIRK